MFLIEMIIKLCHYGVKEYWKNTWNILDGTLVLISIPSLVLLFVPVNMIDLSVLLVLRVLRVFRLFRLAHVFPNFTQIVRNFMLALRQSSAVLLGIVILIMIFAVISCSMFKTTVPKYFATPFDSIYTTFRLFTLEG